MAQYPRLSITSPTQIYTLNATSHSITIGRSLKCDFNIPKEDLSREHCRIDVENEEYFITDLDSKNGVFVDRLRILPQVRTKITESSHVVLASIYQLKINAYEIKTRSDIVIKIPRSDTETVTFEMDFSKDKPVEKVPKKKGPELSPVRETSKIIAGFVVALTVLIFYQAFGV